MLQLTRLSGPVFALNPDLIERAEATPDTVVTLVNGSKYVIRESLDELIDLVRDYRAGVVLAAQHAASGPEHGTSHHRSAVRPADPHRDALHRDAVHRDAVHRANVVLLHADNGEA